MLGNALIGTENLKTLHICRGISHTPAALNVVLNNGRLSFAFRLQSFHWHIIHETVLPFIQQQSEITDLAYDGAYADDTGTKQRYGFRI